jgi:hypothetical protein
MFGRDPYSYDNGHEDGLREGRSQTNAQWRCKLEYAEARIRELEQLNADLAASPRAVCKGAPLSPNVVAFGMRVADRIDREHALVVAAGGTCESDDASERNLQQAVQDLGALEKIRGHAALANVVELLKMDRDDSACVNDSEVELFDELLELLQPGEVSK